MAMGRIVGKVANTMHHLVLGVAQSKPVEKVVSTGAKALGFGIDKGAGLANTAIEGAQKAVEKAARKETYEQIGHAVNKHAGKVTRNVLTDDSAYKQVGKIGGAPIGVANKNLIADDMRRRVDNTLNTIAGAATYKSKLGNNLADALDSEIPVLNMPSKMIRGMSNGLVTTGGDNLLPMGIKATGFGAVVAAAVQTGRGTPDAVKKWNEGRQGTNMDSRPVTSAPQLPAYAQNGGATGDLVFALNNLRHGGMM